MLSKKRSLATLSPEERLLSVTYGSRAFSGEIPRFEIPEEGMPAEAAYRLITDELNLDGNPALNLATFVTTWMEPEAEKLIGDTLNKNLVDQEEYPQTGVIQERAVNILARLFNAPRGESGVGTATVGPSAAIMLATRSTSGEVLRVTGTRTVGLSPADGSMAAPCDWLAGWSIHHSPPKTRTATATARNTPSTVRW